MPTKPIAAIFAAALLTACGSSDQPADSASTDASDEPDISVTAQELEGNPFMEEWDTPFGVPPFERIQDEHYMPAFKKGILDLRADYDAIINNPDAPTFENTIVAMELAGETIRRVRSTFGPLTGTELNDNLRDLQREFGPMWSRERDAILFNPTLFERVQAVYDQRDSLDLDEQQARLLELTHRRFIRSGAALSDDVKAAGRRDQLKARGAIHRVWAEPAGRDQSVHD